MSRTMIGAYDIAGLRRSAPDYTKAERLKRRFKELRQERHPFFLTGSELDEVLRWKLINQYGRVRAKLSANTESAYRRITQAAFAFESDGDDCEVEVRVAILTCLRGVGVPVASAILALVEPEKYCVIDFRGWRSVFGKEKRIFTIRDYKQFLAEIRRLGTELGWSPQEVDLAVWEYDRRASGRRSR